jgi:hypothetical protein
VNESEIYGEIKTMKVQEWIEVLEDEDGLGRMISV